MAQNEQKMTLREIKEDKDKFLRVYGIEEDYSKSGLKWDTLMKIAEHFDNERPEYEKIALDYVKQISGFEHIHSVKFRVKKVDSLIKKIITKAKDGLEYVEAISTGNYMIEITDLIGIRVLYVFKSDYLAVHRQIWKKYGKQMTQDVHIKLRDGDDESIYKDMKRQKPVFEHNKTYRSIHYTMMSSNDQNSARMEIQTRTIFEEGWSEINHKLVYKNENVASYYFLNQASSILSALAGDCDVLGDLMKHLQEEYTNRITDVNADQKETKKESEKIMVEIMNEFLHKK